MNILVWFLFSPSRGNQGKRSLHPNNANPENCIWRLCDPSLIFAPFPFPISPPWASLPDSPTQKKKTLPPGLALLWREQRTQPRLCGRRNLPFRSWSFQLRHFRCLRIQGRLLAAFVLHHFQTLLLHVWPYRPLCVCVAVIWCQGSRTEHSRGVLFWTSGQSHKLTWLSCPWTQSSFCGALSFPLIFPDQVSGFSVLDRASRTPPGIFVCLHGHRSLSTLTTVKVQIWLNSTSRPTFLTSFQAACVLPHFCVK